MVNRDKLDARTRHLLDAAGEHAGELSVILRGAGPFTEQQLDDVAACGVRVRSVAGDVSTATAQDAAAVGELTELDFVVAVQVSGPLFPEAGPDR
jgi:hypothetical protein